MDNYIIHKFKSWGDDDLQVYVCKFVSPNVKYPISLFSTQTDAEEYGIKRQDEFGPYLITLVDICSYQECECL